MNVMRENLSQRSKHWKTRLRNKNAPIFNTYRTGMQQPTSRQPQQNFISSSESSSANQTMISVNQGILLATAERTSSSSNLVVPTTNHVFLTPRNIHGVNLQRRQEPRITDTFLAESFQTPRQQSKSSTEITLDRAGGSTEKRRLQCLPPPSSFSGGKKSRSISSSGPHPLTTPSTSRTPRTPKSSVSFESAEHYVIIAITEGRGIARGEVGIAAIDMRHPFLILCQISDSQTYVNTMMKINVLNANEVLVPNTFVEGQTPTKLFTLINENFPAVTITTVQRRHFSDSIGMAQVNSLCLPQYSSVELVTNRKFYALSSAAALLKYVEFVKNVIFAPKSLKIVYQSASDVMNIDVETAQRLELVLSRSSKDTSGSLFGILNHCSTISGSRFLRANILQPPSSLPQIEKRLHCVTELVQSPAFLHTLQSTLSKFKDVEQLLWLCVQTPKYKDDETAAENQMNYILLLKSTVDNIPVLKDCIQDAQGSFFKNVLKDLADEKFEIILNCINEVIKEDARVAKGYAASQTQRCYAVKTGINGLLDLARRTYSEIIDCISDTVRTIAEEFDLPLKVSNTGNKGFHINLNLGQRNQFNINDLPPVFIQINRTKNLITCTTEELVVFNQRIKLALKEIRTISNLMVFQLLQNIRQHISCLYRLCENIAELDILVSFAQVSSSDNYVRPTFGNQLKLIDSRHPILDFINPSSPVPNDVFASSDKNFHLITGPNMGGKSIYIRQVALLQIMAQIGCYVPATCAEFRITNWLFSRIGFDDSIEHNASSFMLEMEEMQYICRNICSNSLVIIDELGRSTSVEEGTAISWAFCEHLLQYNAFVFFTTHLIFLTKLQDLYPNLTNSYMKAEEKIEGEECRLIYTHKLYPGVNQVCHYGLKLARVTALPQSILNLAASIIDKLDLQQKPVAVVECSHTDDKIIDVVNKWIELKKNGKLTFKEMKQMQLKMARNELQPEECKGNNELVNTDERICEQAEQDSVMQAVDIGGQNVIDQGDNEDQHSDKSTVIVELEHNSQVSQVTNISVDVEDVFSPEPKENTEFIISLSPVFSRIPLYTESDYRAMNADDCIEE